jgi:hypothetical protein
MLAQDRIVAMTREQISQTLLYMERLRLDSYEAESRAEERRLTQEYGRLWRMVRPYVEGKIPYSSDEYRAPLKRPE